MNNASKDLGEAMVLLERLSHETLPKALEIKQRLDRGEKLTHWDIEFLEELFKRSMQLKPLLDRHPEYQDVYAQTVNLYKQITDQALANETGSPGNG